MRLPMVVPPLPSQIGTLRVIGRLGAGGMAEVFLARRTGIEGFARRVVVKRMLPHLVNDEELRTALLDEGRILARIQHPNVVAVEEIGFDDHGYYLVLEHLRGTSLSALVRELRSVGARLDPAVAVHIVAEVAAGLHAAHEVLDERHQRIGVVHRDVSPHNILLTIHGETKLIDFGIALFAGRSSHTQSGVAKGKVAYMAPEQYSGVAPDHRADVFALGVVLHELLTNRRLFARASDAEIVKAILEDRIPSLREQAPELDLPRSLEDVCARALARDPDDRFSTAADMRAALRAVLRTLDPDQTVRDRVAILARTYAADPEDRAITPKETATLPDVNAIAPEHDQRSRPLPASPPTAPAVRIAPAKRRLAAALSAAGALLGLGGVVLGGLALGGLAAGDFLGGVLGTGALGTGALATGATAPEVAPPVGAAPEVAITIESVPPGADVLVAGEHRGRTPLAVRLAASDEPVVLRVSLGDRAIVDTLVPDRPRTLRVHLGPP